MLAVGDSFWGGRRVLVTGATGLVGSHLVRRLLEQRAAIVALVRDADPQSELLRSGDIQRVTVVNGCLEDLRVLQRAITEHSVETVFHLGAQATVGVANRAPWATFESNIRGSYNLLEACRLNADQVRQIVIASSDKAYGDSGSLPYTEDTPLSGRHPYDASKSCTDIIAQTYHHTYGLPLVVARCGNVYGAGDLNWSRIVPGTIRSLLLRQRPVIRSNGRFVRDYIYLKDVVRAYLMLAQRFDSLRLQGHAFNFSTDLPLTVLEIVSAIQRLMKRTELEPVILDEARAEIEQQSLSSKKAREILGWRHEYDLEAGLGETVAWYEGFLGGEP